MAQETNRIIFNILAKDVEETARFYEALCGLTRLYTSDWYIVLTPGEGRSYEPGIIDEVSEFVPKAARGLFAGGYLTLVVDDARGPHQSADMCGYRASPPRSTMARCRWCATPMGSWSIFQRPLNRAERRGVSAVVSVQRRSPMSDPQPHTPRPDVPNPDPIPPLPDREREPVPPQPDSPIPIPEDPQPQRPDPEILPDPTDPGPRGDPNP